MKRILNSPKNIIFLEIDKKNYRKVLLTKFLNYLIYSMQYAFWIIVMNSERGGGWQLKVDIKKTEFLGETDGAGLKLMSYWTILK